MSDKDFDTIDASLIICPYCGHEKKNSCDDTEYLKGYEEKIECGKCGKEFFAIAEIDVKYSTWKINRRKDGDNVIDACAACSNFVKVDDASFYPSCNNNWIKGRKITSNPATHIAYFCNLEDAD